MIKLELSDTMLNVIAEALGEMPSKKSLPVILEIQRQVDKQGMAQMQARMTPKPDGKENKNAAN